MIVSAGTQEGRGEAIGVNLFTPSFRAIVILAAQVFFLHTPDRFPVFISATRTHTHTIVLVIRTLTGDMTWR